jgi:AraC-like DNA-binding protein
MMSAYRNAIALSDDPRLAVRLGENCQATTYGMYGYALLSSATYRSACQFAEKYHYLSVPTVDISFDEDGNVASCIVEPLAFSEHDMAIYVFTIERVFSTVIALARDISDADFGPTEIRVTYPRSHALVSYETYFGCPAQFGQGRNEILFDAGWLDRPSRRANSLTFATVQQVCEEMLDRMGMAAGASGRLRRLFIESAGRFPGIDHACRTLGTSPRTLRRKLSIEGTSYKTLINETRVQLAKKYLRETGLTVDEIASRLGYSDASNFRHAFRRLTGMTPIDFRRGSAKRGAEEELASALR